MLTHELSHLILSIGAGIAGWLVFKRVSLIIPAAIAGVMIDIDHLLDYWLYRKALILDISEFLSGGYFEKSGRIVLLLHAYEYALLLFIIGLIMWRRKKQVAGVIMAIGLALVLHLGYDTLYYGPKWQTYWLSYRTYYHFDINQMGF